MAIAAAAVVHPSPPLARRAVAWLACSHLAWATVNDAVICLFLASMWLLFWGLATMKIGRLACGEGCAVVTAAYNVASVAAGVTLVLIPPFCGLLLAMIMARKQAAPAATATDIEATKPAPETSSSAMRDTPCDSLALGLLALLAFPLLVLIGALVKGDSPVTGSRREIMGSVINEVGALGMALGNCFVLCPIMTVRVWKAWRMARHAL